MAYHNYVLDEEPKDPFRPYIMLSKSQSSGRWTYYKRLRNLVGNCEGSLWRYMSTLDPPNSVNIAFPEDLLWHDKIMITPVYHSAMEFPIVYGRSLLFCRQLAEAVSFLHKNRIAHLDIHAGNCVVAINSKSDHQLLLVDFELAHRFAHDESPVIDLWWLYDPWDMAPGTPPEGIHSVNAFACDIYRAGAAMYFFSSTSTFSNVTGKSERTVLPPDFESILKRMMSKSPSDRPVAEAVLASLLAINETEAPWCSEPPAESVSPWIVNKTVFGDCLITPTPKLQDLSHTLEDL